MAILSTLLPHIHKYDPATATLLRSTASSKMRYPEFITTLLLNYPNDIPLYMYDTGFFQTYKRMIEQPTEQELTIMKELVTGLALFPAPLRIQIQTERFKWPELTDARLIAIKEALITIQPRKEDKKKSFYEQAMACDPSILTMGEEEILLRVQKLSEDKKTILLTHWASIPEFSELGSNLMTTIYC